MSKKLFSLLLIPMIVLLVSCGDKEQPEVQNQDMKVGNPPTEGVHNVLVEEKLDANNYSYLRVNEQGNSFWIAVNKMEINPGEYVIFSKFMEMKNFKSESLSRTFEAILFVDDAAKSAGAEQLKSPHQNVATGKDVSIDIKPLDGGYTIEQIYSKKSSLEFKTVKVKGKVVKVNEGIMGTNWIHIQDGTGKDGTHDLLITTNESVKVGAIIIAEGKVIKDKDFGSGYFYNVLIENSKISVQ